MAEFSIVPLGEIAQAERWDAEFFRPYFRELGKKLSGICQWKMTDFASPSISLFNSSVVSTFQYVEISDVDLATGETESKEIRAAETPDRAQFLMHGGEILVSTVRPNRSGIGLLGENATGYVASSGFAPLLARDERWRSYLFVWLKIQAITDWLDRQSKASMYPAVAASDVLQAPVFHPGDAVLDKVHGWVREIEATMRRGRELYPEAEQELLERLGWGELQKQKSELFYVESTAELDRMSRVDAEHFQPKFRRLREHLLKQGAAQLGAVCASVAKGTQPSVYVDDGEVVVVKSKNVFSQGVDFDNCERTTMDAYADIPARLASGDLVINSTGFGTLGRAAFIPPRNEKIVASVDLVILRLQQEVLPEYAALFLSSPAGLAQSEMFQTGSSGQLHLYPQHIKEFLIYLPRNRDGSIDLAWQKKLADKVVGASQAKQQAQEKLAQAKKLVEDAVESASLKATSEVGQ